MGNDLSSKIKELERMRPDMFIHPKLKPNEVWLGDTAQDIADMTIAWYSNAGRKSARRTEESHPGKILINKKPVEIQVHSVFVDVLDYIKIHPEIFKKWWQFWK